MSSHKPIDRRSVVESNYFSNWGDLWYPRIANSILRPASAIRWLTPNQVTLTSFVLYALAAALLMVGKSWALAIVLLLPVSYILDCLDGQLARYTGRTSPIGDYLDKTLDVLKIGLINVAMGVAAYRLTGKDYYLILGFISCFGFLFRYYIKLETMFGAINRDKDYLRASRARRHELYATFDAAKRAPMTIRQRMNWLYVRHHAVLALDEAEHVTFGALAALFWRPDLWCWAFAVGQLSLALFRLVERGGQLLRDPESLTYPLRK
ncbi:MAG: CDP-alcohol phosphatidyltransferase family protein [Candidatus Saccharibacteria bacterium]